MLDTLDGDSGLDPACPPVGEVIPTVGILVDSVRGVREVSLHHLPRPRPGKVGEIPLPLRVLVAVDCIEHGENIVLLHGC